MNAPALALLIGCLSVECAVVAQEKLGPEFLALKSQFDAKAKLEAQQPYDVGVVDLNVKYTTALDRALESAQKAGNLDDALAIKSEKEAVALGKGIPATDMEKTPLVMKQLRGAYRTAISRLEAERLKRLQPLQAAFAKSLDTLVISLTKEGKLEAAAAVKERRDELTSSDPPPAPTVLGQPPRISATKDAPYVNSLAMKFVAVPGTEILMCIHQTRKADYAAYAAENPGGNAAWKSVEREGVPVSDGDDHPVVSVSWENATAFCAWLSKKEGKTYRLPTDHEWSLAVGIGTKEPSKGATPESLNGNPKDVYPWGGNWPPPKGAGNYSDTSTKEKMPKHEAIPGYTDGFPTTAPVMSFKPNKLGIYDLSGNAWEWCDDWWNAAKADRVVRGGSWSDSDRANLLSSHRNHYPPAFYHALSGFRVVVVATP